MKRLLIGLAAVTALLGSAAAVAGPVSGGAAGAVGGAVVAGPPGAVVGGVAGVVLGSRHRHHGSRVCHWRNHHRYCR
jgi:hypothetical protein